MKEFIVKIDADKGGLSTGFVHFPEDQNIAYVICALHGLLDEEDLSDSERIEIEFFDENRTKYVLGRQDIIVKGLSLEREDIAFIILSRDVLPKELVPDKAPALLRLLGSEKNCEIKGVSDATENEFIRTLSKVEIEKDQDYKGQLQFHVHDPLAQQSQTFYLIEGYSGSPALITQDGVAYCFGIFTEYEETTKRWLGISLELGSEVLQRSNLRPLQFHTIETNESIRKDVRELRANTTRVIERVKNTIGGIHFEREDIVKFIKALIEGKAITLISGIAGAGKSSLTKSAIELLKGDYEIIALQGEQLDKSSIKEIFSEPSIGIHHDLALLLGSPEMKVKKILLLDSIEKIVETSHAETVKDFFSLLKDRADLKIVLTCRTHASEYLLNRFIGEFPPVADFVVPLLTDTEFNQVLLKYPDLEVVVLNPSIRKVLSVPFNLDKATLLSQDKLKSINTEVVFRNIVWRHVIENPDKEHEKIKQTLRGISLEELAHERAKRKTPYVNLGIDRLETLNKLLSDGIVEQSIDPTKGFAISHDIFEDWALHRFIGKAFHDYFPLKGALFFFSVIGYHPAVRRSYRLWISETLAASDEEIEKFVNTLLRSEHFESLWKDETLLAVLQSPYFNSIILKLKDVLFENNFAILKRCLLLLNVACQKPNFKLIESLDSKESRAIFSNAYLIPYGTAWGVIFEFISDNINRFKDQWLNILPVVDQWAKGIDAFSLPPEARHVTAIVYAYLRKCRTNLDDPNHYDRQSYLSQMVHVLFLLSGVAGAEVRHLLTEAINFKRDHENYRLDSFYSEFVDQVLSFEKSSVIASFFPELVISAARKEWFYFPPSAEEEADLKLRLPMYAMRRTEQEEEIFGISSNIKREYSPAGAFQTPILHLLYRYPNEGIRLIVELFNHSVDTYSASDFLVKKSEFSRTVPRTKIHLQLVNGRTSEQYGSSLLWSIYRGGHVAPDLLKSILKALERYLFELVSLSQSKNVKEAAVYKGLLIAISNHALEHSRSVATTAVIASVCTAHPDVMVEQLFCILRVKEFYLWDLERFNSESRMLNSYGITSLGFLIQEENARSNKLPHRKLHLQTLMIELGFQKKYRPDVVRIIDDFKLQNDQDQDWRFILSSMDYRNLQVVERVKGGFIMKAKLEEDLQELASQNEKETGELLPIQIINSWAYQKITNNKFCTSDEFDEWAENFRVSFSDENSHEYKRLFNHPAVFAFIGLRDFFPRLSDEQKRISIERILSIVRRAIQRSDNPYDTDPENPFTPQESDIAYVALIEILEKESGIIRIEARYLCFWILVLLNDDHQKEELIEKLKIRIPDFALICSSGMSEYATLFPKRLQHRNLYSFYSNRLAGGGFGTLIIKNLFKGGYYIIKDRFRIFFLERGYNVKIKKLSKRITSEDALLYWNIDFTSNVSPHYLIMTLGLIPSNTTNEDARKFIRSLIEYIFDVIEKGDGHKRQDDLSFELFETSQKHIAQFLLEQPLHVTEVVFQNLLTLFFARTRIMPKHQDYIEGCLKKIVHQCKPMYLINFWVMWEYAYSVISKNKYKYFLNCLLLDFEYTWSSQWNWLVHGRSEFFGQIILNETDLVKETSKLLTGAGSKDFLPEGLLWLWKQISNHGIDGKEECTVVEKLVIDVFYNQPLKVAVIVNLEIRRCYIEILDRVIDFGSPSAYLIREDIISST